MTSAASAVAAGLPSASAPGAISLPEAMREAILEHCRGELPNEACGLIAGDAAASRGGRATRWLPARNRHASPYRYELHPDDLVRLTLDIDDAGEVVWAVVHSHTASPAVPSATDVREWRYPDAVQVVVSLGPAAERAAAVPGSVRAPGLADDPGPDPAPDPAELAGIIGAWMVTRGSARQLELDDVPVLATGS
jgi:proteasome lid subunit RPN8/RPN11